MTDHTEYFAYLKRRTWLGWFYRRYVLYPRLVKRLPGHMLDVGCGIGDMINFHPNSVGVDINENNVAFCKEKGLNSFLMTENAIPFDDSAFDSVLLDNVLEHIIEPAPLLLDIRRVLKEGGTLLVGVPGLCGYYSDSDHKVFYDEELMVECLHKSGFKLTELFFAPLVRSVFLGKFLRQYCIYGSFIVE